MKPLHPIPPIPIPSPCVGVCEMRPDGLCEGCLRSLDEIARWSQMTACERDVVMYTRIPQRRQVC